MFTVDNLHSGDSVFAGRAMDVSTRRRVIVDENPGVILGDTVSMNLQQAPPRPFFVLQQFLTTLAEDRQDFVTG